MILDQNPGAVKERTPKLQTYNHDLKLLDQKHLDYFMDRFQLTPEEIEEYGVRYNINRNTIAFPIHNDLGQQVGYVDRDYWNNRSIKSLKYWTHPSEDRLYWATRLFHDRKTVLISEDAVSAIKASRYVNAVALLGTSLSDKQVLYLKKWFKRVVLSLDKDATVTAIELKIKYQALFESWTTVILEKDIKDTDSEEFRFKLVELGVI